MSDFGKRIIPFDVKTIDATTFDGTFLPVESPTDQVVRIVRFINNTDQDVDVSWDGVKPHDFIPSLTALTLDVTANRADDQGFFIGIGTQFYTQAPVGTGEFKIATYGAET